MTENTIVMRRSWRVQRAGWVAMTLAVLLDPGEAGEADLEIDREFVSRTAIERITPVDSAVPERHGTISIIPAGSPGRA
jgi:hypothetical protein